MTHVLVPFDGSTLSLQALEFACERFPEGPITALFVVDTTTPQPEQYVGEKLGDIYEKRETEAKAVLEEAEAVAAEFGIQLRTAIERGPPAKRIVAYAEDRDVDHVVMGSHGRDIFERFFVGSVAERAVDRLPTPVTLVR